MDHALNIMQNALTFKRQHESSYIQFLSHFGPALTGMAFWNNNKTTKLVGELLTITDEAFILLCIINYSATWKAQEKQKLEDTNVLIPVSYIHSVLVCDSTGKQRITNHILIASPLGSPRLQTWQTNCLATMTAQASTCYVDGLAMDSKSSINWPKRFTKTARSMVRTLTRLSRTQWRKTWPAPTKLAKGSEMALTPTMI